MRNSSRAAKLEMPRASAEKTDEMFGRRLTRSFWPDVAAAATPAPAFNPSVQIPWKSKSASNLDQF